MAVLDGWEGGSVDECTFPAFVAKREGELFWYTWCMYFCPWIFRFGREVLAMIWSLRCSI